ncbi:MAG: hypothetical protein MPN21_22355 [Thermoanaerobaculia bacterium]|nr:hypothetical protein [Thermoanaerobaculia bacterium]
MSTDKALATVVGLELQVILSSEDGLWTAQAQQLDYAASGDSEDDVKERFEKGLYATIRQNLKSGSLKEFISQQAPSSDWVELLEEDGSQEFRFSSLSVHLHEQKSDIPEDLRSVMPYKGIRYVPALPLVA